MAATSDRVSVDNDRELAVLAQQILSAKTWNGVLGILNTTPLDVVKKQYRALCKRLHPDKAGAGNEDVNSAFILLQEAYRGVSRRVDGCAETETTAPTQPHYRHVDNSKLGYAWKAVDTRPRVQKRTGPQCRRHRKFLPCSSCRALANPPPPPPPIKVKTSEMLKLFGF